MLMQRIDLCDRLEIRLEERSGVRMRCEGLELAPGEENIAARAARHGQIDVPVDLGGDHR